LALGLLGSGFGAGGFVVLLIVQLIELYQWRTTLIILAIGTWALGIPLSFVIRNRPEEYGYLPDGEAPGPPAQESDIQVKGEEIGLMEAFKRKPFLTLNIVEGIRLIIIGTVILHVMPYLSSVGVSRSTAGLVASAVPLLSIIGRFGFGWLGDIVSKKVMMAVTFGLMSLGMLVFGFVHMGWVIFLFLIIFPLGHGGSMVLRGSILRDYFGRDDFGKMIGIIMGSGAVGGIIGPTLAGWMFDVLGTYQPVWFIFFVLSGLATVLILRIKQAPAKMP
jgi:sugar phosphate permease